MKYFVLTSTGEIGPFTMAQLNRNFAAGTIHGAQLCRAENSQERRRLDEQFRHMGGNQAVVEAARVNVAKYQREDGHSTRTVGSLMVISGFLGLFSERRPLVVCLALLIIGIVLISRGAKQEKRGESQLPPTTPSDPSAPDKGPKRPYEY